MVSFNLNFDRLFIITHATHKCACNKTPIISPLLRVVIFRINYIKHHQNTNIEITYYYLKMYFQQYALAINTILLNSCNFGRSFFIKAHSISKFFLNCYKTFTNLYLDRSVQNLNYILCPQGYHLSAYKYNVVCIDFKLAVLL